jgi:hypothetical protein
MTAIWDFVSESQKSSLPGSGSGKTAAFTVARGAQAGLADPAVNRFRDAVQVILKQGTPEECDWVETFKFNPEAEDGYQRFDARLTKREARAFDSFTDLLGLSRQIALVVACLLVLKDVAATWRPSGRTGENGCGSTISDS